MFLTYARFSGIGWLFGWFLVGISQTKTFGGYARDFAASGCSLMLVESDAPLIHRFWFTPNKCKIIEKLENERPNRIRKRFG